MAYSSPKTAGVRLPKATKRREKESFMLLLVPSVACRSDESVSLLEGFAIVREYCESVSLEGGV